MRTTIALSLSLLAAGSLFAGNVYYVDPDGDDSANGLTPATARQSLVEAMQLVLPGNGDIVYAAEGTYSLKSDGGYRVKIPRGYRQGRLVLLHERRLRKGARLS